MLTQLLGFTLFSMLLPSQVHPQPPADFDFRFRYTACSTNELDTFSGWFTTQLPDGNSLMTQLSLNASRMRYLYEIVTKINFFDIPSHFQGKPIEPPTNGAVVRYEMDVRSHGRFHSVRWDDDQSDRGPLADGLRRLFGWTVSFILDAPEVKRLPLSSSPCGKD